MDEAISRSAKTIAKNQKLSKYDKFNIIDGQQRITTISRREILREQVFECLFQSSIEPSEKRSITDKLNSLFAGEFHITINKHITFVDFEQSESSSATYMGIGDYAGAQIELTTIGSNVFSSCSKLTIISLNNNYTINNFKTIFPYSKIKTL